MILGVVSDTHGRVENARAGARLLESLEVEQVLHCGDIGSTEVMAQFEPWTTHFVLGNTDHDPRALAAGRSAHHLFHGDFGELSLAGRKIALLHGDDARRLQRAIAGGLYDLVCHGHTHVARCEWVGKTLVLNPGALFRAPRHTIAIVDLTALKAEIISVS